tara:strand:- start:147 stop:584 length:438 start_codon:yes stop_codon:yes gene_type:complete
MENLRNIVKNHLSDGVVLMNLVHDSNSDFIKITVDSPGNISIKDTSLIAKRIKNDDSILSMFPRGCSLEVGTPGIGAALMEKFQYKKNIGRKIFLEFRNDDHNIISDVFRLIDVKDKSISVSKNESDFLILFENIILAKIKVTID